jgi:PleD family two-component response regulator
VILCAIDDLIFSIKISTAAKRLGVEMYFERTPDMVLPRIREKRPTLIIFDLNATRLNPMAVIAALKADADLKDTRTLGYVSHVDSDAITAARSAGIDQVLARSAFSDRLGEILTTAGTTTR